MSFGINRGLKRLTIDVGAPKVEPDSSNDTTSEVGDKFFSQKKQTDTSASSLRELGASNEDKRASGEVDDQQKTKKAIARKRPKLTVVVTETEDTPGSTGNSTSTVNSTSAVGEKFFSPENRASSTSTPNEETSVASAGDVEGKGIPDEVFEEQKEIKKIINALYNYPADADLINELKKLIENHQDHADLENELKKLIKKYLNKSDLKSEIKELIDHHQDHADLKNELKELIEKHPNDADLKNKLKELIEGVEQKDTPALYYDRKITDGENTYYTFPGITAGISGKGCNKMIEAIVDQSGELYILATEIASKSYEVNSGTYRSGDYAEFAGTNHLSRVSEANILHPKVLVRANFDSDVEITGDEIKGNLAYISKFCSKGNLKTYLKAQNSSDDIDKIKIDAIRSLLEAHVELSSKSLVHLDIKEDNIFVDEKDGSIRYLLADTDGIINLKEYSKKTNLEGLTFNNAAPGTKNYYDPNIMDQRSVHGCKDDTFQIGALMHRLLYGKDHPNIKKREKDDAFASYGSPKEASSKDKLEHSDVALDDISLEKTDPLEHLINQMMENDYEKRINGADALEEFKKITASSTPSSDSSE